MTITIILQMHILSLHPKDTAGTGACRLAREGGYDLAAVCSEEHWRDLDEIIVNHSRQALQCTCTASGSRAGIMRSICAGFDFWLTGCLNLCRSKPRLPRVHVKVQALHQCIQPL